MAGGEAAGGESAGGEEAGGEASASEAASGEVTLQFIQPKHAYEFINPKHAYECRAIDCYRFATTASSLPRWMPRSSHWRISEWQTARLILNKCPQSLEHSLLQTTCHESTAPTSRSLQLSLRKSVIGHSQIAFVGRSRQESSRIIASTCHQRAPEPH